MYQDKTPESLKAAMLSKLSGMDTREGSFAEVLVSAVAYEIWKYYTALQKVEPITFVDETSGIYIDKRCEEYGIKRKPGAKAKVRMSFTGKESTIIPKGKSFLTAEGMEFTTVQAVSITSGKATVEAEAVEIGERYNIRENELTLQIAALTGLSGWENSPGIGGMDEETDESLVRRLYEYLRTPATSGNAFHYRQWALETPGVGSCKVFPLWNGAGTVKIVVTDQGGNPATEEVVNSCATHIEELRPIGATVTVVSAEALTCTVAATVILDSTTTLKDVQEQFSKQLSDYLKSIAFVKDSIIYNRIAFMLLDIGGVQDYTALTVNGGTKNIPLAAEQIPVKGEISIEST